MPLVVDWLHPRSVVDVGCGVGTWLAEFRKLGVGDVIGVDGDYVDRAKLQIPPDRFVAKDLAAPLTLGRTFDLVTSLEVAEHLPATAADGFVAALVDLGPVVLFSAAIPGQGGEGHVNEEWPQAWARRFAAHGYRWADPLRSLLWNDARVEFWYAQNLLVFHRADAFAMPPWPVGTPTGDGTAAGTSPLSLVHPTLLGFYVKRRPTFKRAWREMRRSIRSRFTRRGGA